MDSFESSYEATPDAVARVRADLAAFAAGHGMHACRVDDLRLAVSEAVTNAVLHAYRGAGGTVHVTARLDDGALWVSVRDFGAGMHPRGFVAGRSGMGLGLALLGRIAGELSIVAPAGGGTELRMRFELMPAPLRGKRRPVAASA